MYSLKLQGGELQSLAPINPPLHLFPKNLKYHFRHLLNLAYTGGHGLGLTNFFIAQPILFYILPRLFYDLPLTLKKIYTNTLIEQLVILLKQSKVLDCAPAT